MKVPNDVMTFTAMTAEEFELAVKGILEKSAHGLSAFHAEHREKLKGLDGSYEIDITARFEALGANFLVLVECKHHKNPIKRELVQVLHDRMRSTGAQKGMLFSTSGFQEGALEYAKLHGIALVRMVEGKTIFETKSFGPPVEPPPWVPLPPFVGWWITMDKPGVTRQRLWSNDCSEYLDLFLHDNSEEANNA